MYKILFHIAALILLLGCINEKQQSEKILRHYIEKKEGLIRNYSIESAVALWNATVSGNDNDYQKVIDVEMEFTRSNQSTPEYFSPDRISSVSRNIFTNEEDFQILKKLKYSGLITDTLLSRQLTVLYHAYMGSQIGAEKYQNLLSTEVNLWQSSDSKIEINGHKYGLYQIDSLRKATIDTTILKSIFESVQNRGTLIAPNIIKMVKERNAFAANFGYPDYYHLALEIKDQTSEKLKLFLDEIELKTRTPYMEAKRVIDKMLAKRYRIENTSLPPWCYKEDQSSYLPNFFKDKMDSLYINIDPIAKAATFFEGIGIPIQDVINNSDLKYRQGKSTATSMINIDFKNDIRLISNIQNTHEGMFRMMHLGGHASHYKSISDSVPYLLKNANSAIGEGVSKFFERLTINYTWLKTEVYITPNKQKEYQLICQHMQSVDGIFRCRYMLMLTDFERSIYNDPNQNLDLLWSNLNKKYLVINYSPKNNSCYWATNKYATNLSCTIHNLLLAEIFAAQLQHAIETNVLKKTNGVYSNNKAVGKYLIDNLYRYGDLYPWYELIKKATGEPLKPDYYINMITEKTNE